MIAHGRIQVLMEELDSSGGVSAPRACSGLLRAALPGGNEPRNMAFLLPYFCEAAADFEGVIVGRRRIVQASRTSGNCALTEVVFDEISN